MTFRLLVVRASRSHTGEGMLQCDLKNGTILHDFARK
jgi:hypothetical protein